MRKFGVRAKGVAEGAHGELFMCDALGDCVTVISAIRKPRGGGKHLRQFGSFGIYPGIFNHPCGIAVAPPGAGHHEGEVVVADFGNHRVQVFKPDGTFLRVCGSGQLKFPEDVAVTHGAGPSGDVEVVVTDSNSVWVYRLSDGAFLRQLRRGAFMNPAVVCITTTNKVRGSVCTLAPCLFGLKVLVSDYRDCIQVFNLCGVFLFQWGSTGSGPGQFDHPWGMAVRGNEVWVADGFNNRVQVFRLLDGVFMYQMDVEHPIALAVTHTDQVLVCQAYSMLVFQ